MFKLLGYAKKYKGYVLFCPILMIGEVVFELLIPLVMAQMVDVALPQKNMELLCILGLKMVALALASLVCGCLAARVGAVAGMGFGTEVRNKLMEKIQSFSFGNIDRFSTASLVTRITTDVNTVQNTFLMMIKMLVRAPIMFLVALVICIMKSKQVSEVFLYALPAIAIVIIIGGPIALMRFKKMLKMFDGFNGSIQENLINIRVVKSFVRTDYEKKKFKKANDDLYETSVSAGKIMVWGQPLIIFIMYCSIFMVLYVSAKEISAQTMQIGDFSAIFSYVMQILMFFLMILFLIAEFFMSQASAKRILEVLREEPEISDKNATETNVENGDVEFKNVSFAYGDNQVLKNISFKINNGETVGIMGGTGSAKSTLVQLIPRLYDVSSGEILVGGKNVKSYKLKSLRESVSMVLQKNVLFSGTIIENLRWGNKNADEKEIENVCKMVEADGFIKAFPDGYNTELGQGGVNVSGGQKQRLCIARAILKNPKILILDDSTSAVDTYTDAKIREGLKNYLPNTTKLIISQRVISLENCDKIIVLNDGEINDMGTHEELLERNELYKEIYESQQKKSDDFDEGGEA